MRESHFYFTQNNWVDRACTQILCVWICSRRDAHRASALHAARECYPVLSTLVQHGRVYTTGPAKASPPKRDSVVQGTTDLFSQREGEVEMFNMQWLGPGTPNHCHSSGVACGGLKPFFVNFPIKRMIPYKQKRPNPLVALFELWWGSNEIFGMPKGLDTPCPLVFANVLPVLETALFCP
jgi:hypothetical protein